ncbi:MAG: hypothetical protein LN417_00800 [Candidatus Thermoplasmatota archaeon]|nr:hypothetical protein [Candidatus Thermoplasmatota archaeon]
MTWHENGLVGWGFNNIPAARDIEMLVEVFCRMFSSFFIPLELEMYRLTGDMRIRLENVGIIPAMVKQYGCANRPVTILCKSKVRKTSGYLVEEQDVPGNGADSSIFAGLDEDGYQYVTLELSSDEWFRDDTDPEWLTVFNNCFGEAVRVLEVGEVACDCREEEFDDLVDDHGFSPRMFQKLAAQENEVG